MQQVIKPSVEGQFRLQDTSADTAPGIKRTETESDIEVTYQNRFQLYDEAEQVSKAVLQTKSIKTEKAVPRIGVMLVGLGGNNGSTFTAGILANRR